MLDWLTKKFRQDSDAHPFMNDRGVDDFIEQLPSSHPEAALAAIGEVFEQAAQLPLDPARRRRVLRNLDTHAQGYITELWHVLFEGTQGEKISERAWQALYVYFGHAPAGLVQCIEKMPPRGKWDKEDIDYAGVFACRAMSAMMRRNLLMRIRYRASTDEFWRGVNGLYALSETAGLLRLTANPYEDDDAQTSVLREYLVGMLLEVSPYGVLMPIQLLCLDTMLRHFSNLLVLRDQPDELTGFFLDPASGNPPTRWLPGLRNKERCRYFGTGAAQSYFDTMLARAVEKKPMPDWVVITGCDPERYRQLLERVPPHWSSKPPQRGHRREADQGDLLVSHSFSLVRRMIAYSEYARSGKQVVESGGYSTSKEEFDNFHSTRFDTVQLTAASIAEQMRLEKLRLEGKLEDADTPKGVLTPVAVLEKLETAGDKQMMQRWKLADQSETGVGAITPQLASWVRVGMLVGYRRSDQLEWIPAIIRRRGRDAKGNQTIGMQNFGGAANSARARVLELDEGKYTDGSVGEDFREAILIEGTPATLILIPGFFKAGRHVLLRSDGKTRKARLLDLVETGTDFEVVKTEMLAEV